LILLLIRAYYYHLLSLEKIVCSRICWQIFWFQCTAELCAESKLQAYCEVMFKRRRRAGAHGVRWSRARSRRSAGSARDSPMYNTRTVHAACTSRCPSVRPSLICLMKSLWIDVRAPVGSPAADVFPVGNATHRVNACRRRVPGYYVTFR